MIFTPVLIVITNSVATPGDFSHDLGIWVLLQRPWGISWDVLEALGFGFFQISGFSTSFFSGFRQNVRN